MPQETEINSGEPALSNQSINRLRKWNISAVSKVPYLNGTRLFSASTFLELPWLREQRKLGGLLFCQSLHFHAFPACSESPLT